MKSLNVRQKRNKPCENCRTHRRKCVNRDHSTCERCQKLNLECVYKISEKPSKPVSKPTVSLVKRNKLFEAVWLLKQETDTIQFQLSQLKNALTTTTTPTTITNEAKQSQDTIQTLPAQSSMGWKLTITSKSNNHELHLQTSIRSMADLSFFLKEAFSVFTRDSQQHLHHSPTDLASSTQFLPITLKCFKTEETFRNVVKKEKVFVRPYKPPPLQQTWPDPVLQQVKVKMIKTFFRCHHWIIPILIKSHYEQLLSETPDSLLSTALASFVAYSQCFHIHLEQGPVMTRTEFAEKCRVEAKETVQEVLFETEPSLELSLTLWLLSCSSFYAQRNAEGRTYSSLCWQMVNALKPTFNRRTDVESEVWRRLFHRIRFHEFNMCRAVDGSQNFSSVAHDVEVGTPTPLACEQSDETLLKAVLCYQYTTRLTTKPDDEMATLRMMAGVLDPVPARTLQHIECTLLRLWNSTPSGLRLGSGPYDWIDPVVVTRCRHPSILRFNAIFYVHWLSFQARVMSDTADLNSVTLARIDGDRSLLIASICSDAACKIFCQLAAVMPCLVELHWLMMCIDILNILSGSTHRPSRVRAQRNLADITVVLKRHMDCIGHPSSYPSASQAPFLNQIKEAIVTYMLVNNIP
ncbi:MAG: hypothetical protein EXX96DRAFT_553111 [Benjaminiella poitrasii]|nr:MAG: hypothetical protein EXX96DRAFT_553111 [Benjaminiella poitrasii]